MVLGSTCKGITYSKSIYYSAQPYSFGYLENGLTIEPDAWDDETNQWLASLLGLKYSRVVPPRGSDPDRSWDDYLRRIETALKSGCPVATSRGWLGAKEEGGEITSEIGGRLFWWEGLSKKHRPDMHYFTVIGLDRSSDRIYFHDPVFGWFGWGKDVSVPLNKFRYAVQRTPWQHRYITITFEPTGRPEKGETEINRLVKKRIVEKIKGDPSAYNSVEMWQEFFGRERIGNFKRGLSGLEAFKRDLQPERFEKILAFKLKRHKMQPSSVVSWIDLVVYHKAWIALIGAEYLEKSGQIDNWQRLFRLHMLYEKLGMSTAKLRSIFKADNDLDSAMPPAGPVLKEMQKTIDEMIAHLKAEL